MMPRGFEIRNKHIEAAYQPKTSEVITRPMTSEEWAKYGPKSEKQGIKLPQKLCERKEHVMKKKLTIPIIIELAKKHTLSREGRSAIAQECGISRVDVTNFINRGYVKKALQEAGIVISPEKLKLVEDIAKELQVTETKPKSKLNPKVELHMNLCADLHETYVAKNTAYGNSFSITFKEFGIISALTRMSDKWNRIKALATGTRNDVKDESLEDTLLDLANYCLMTVMELKGE